MQEKGTSTNRKEDAVTNSYVAIDIETTGLEPKIDKITEIAALKVVDGSVAGRYVTPVSYTHLTLPTNREV